MASRFSCFNEGGIPQTEWVVCREDSMTNHEAVEEGQDGRVGL